MDGERNGKNLANLADLLGSAPSAFKVRTLRPSEVIQRAVRGQMKTTLRTARWRLSDRISRSHPQTTVRPLALTWRLFARGPCRIIHRLTCPQASWT